MNAAISLVFGTIMLFLCEVSAATPINVLLCQDSNYTCYKVKKGDTWEKLFPDPAQRNVVMRVNRMNITLNTLRNMQSNARIAIPKNLHDTNIMNYSPLPKQISAPGGKMIFVSLNEKVLAWGAYNAQGSLQAWGPVSGGRGWCPDMKQACHTKLGKFTIYREQGAFCKSSKFPIGHGGAPMPYCMYFHGGFALHGSYTVPGFNDSHGCIRLLIPDAEWLNKDFVTDDQPTSVVIVNTAP